MPKLIFLALILGLCLQAKAETFSSNTKRLEFNGFRDAAILAMGDKTSCFFRDKEGGGYNLDYLVNGAREVVVNDSDSQPLLAFNNYRKWENVDLVQVVMTTSSDYKKIVTMEVREYYAGKVNYGNLRHPNVVNGYVYRRTCKVDL